MRFLVFFYIVQVGLKIILGLDTILFWLTSPIRTWQRRRFRRDWGQLERSIELAFEQLEMLPGDFINDEYCWMHQPGG